MALWTRWKDHVTQFTNRYKEVQNADGTITHEPVEGTVIQEGTPQNAQNFNDLEQRVVEAGQNASIALLESKVAKTKLNRLKGEIIQGALTNTKEYPFNNSQKTLAIVTPRDNTDYTVDVEAVANDTGGIGEIQITDKQLNGFKIAYSGTATSVSVKCTVQGGNY